MNECIPRKRLSAKKKIRSWFSKELISICKEKDKAYCKWKVSGENNHKAAYKRLVKKVKKELFVTKKNAFFEAFKDCKDTSKFWKAINKFSGRNSHQEIPTLTSHLQNEISENSERAEALRQQFSSVFTPMDCQLNDLTETQYKPDEYNNSTPCVSVKSILKHIRKLSTNKAMEFLQLW